jgi:cellulose synthase/poly-beta-1,6-N-acetylglucosamine synthase-like glycosyltransferase
MDKYISRITSSARGELFNPLLWPFLLSTFAYGVGFTFTNGGGSSLYLAMAEFGLAIPIVWGVVALMVIIGGLTFLLFNIPPFGKVSGLIGFMAWLFAAACFLYAGSWLPFFSVAVPNMWFWIWQYLSLSQFRREDAIDAATMVLYDDGQYDNEENPKDGKIDRECNRGKDLQSNQSYDTKDNGGDCTRALDCD